MLCLTIRLHRHSAIILVFCSFFKILSTFLIVVSHISVYSLHCILLFVCLFTIVLCYLVLWPQDWINTTTTTYLTGSTPVKVWRITNYLLLLDQLLSSSYTPINALSLCLLYLILPIHNNKHRRFDLTVIHSCNILRLTFSFVTFWDIRIVRIIHNKHMRSQGVQWVHLHSQSGEKIRRNLHGKFVSAPQHTKCNPTESKRHFLTLVCWAPGGEIWRFI